MEHIIKSNVGLEVFMVYPAGQDVVRVTNNCSCIHHAKNYNVIIVTALNR